MKLIIPYNQYIRLRAYAQAADGEISGFAKTKIENSNIIIEEVRIFEQESTSGTTDLDSNDLAKFMYELTKEGKSTEHWNCWWHSHAETDVFLSPKDEKTIMEQRKLMPFFIALVINKKDDFLANVTIFPQDQSPFQIETHYSEDIPVEVEKYSPEIQKQIEKIDKQIKNLKEKKEVISAITIPEEIEKEIQAEVEKKVKQPEIGFRYNQNYSQQPGLLKVDLVKFHGLKVKDTVLLEPEYLNNKNNYNYIEGKITTITKKKIKINSGKKIFTIDRHNYQDAIFKY